MEGEGDRTTSSFSSVTQVFQRNEVFQSKKRTSYTLPPERQLCVCLSLCTHVCTYVHTYMYTLSARMSVCVYACIYVRTSANVYTTSAYVCLYVCMYVRTYVCICIHYLRANSTSQTQVCDSGVENAQDDLAPCFG